MKTPAHTLLIFAAVLPLSTLTGQVTEPGKDHIDSILERRTFTPQQLNALDLGGGTGGAKDGKVDVRDLVLHLKNVINTTDPVLASFETSESVHYASAGTVTIPIVFSKPVNGTLLFDLGGDADLGAQSDYTLDNPSISLTNSTRVNLSVRIRPWRGMGGEKIIRITLKRDPQNTQFANGQHATHLLRLRQYEMGEFAGMLSFPPDSLLPSMPVRIGLRQGGSGDCSYQSVGTLLGTGFQFAWSSGGGLFPVFSSSPITLALPGLPFGRPEGSNVTVKLALQSFPTPLPEDLDEYLKGFPAGERPAAYRASFTFENLFAAGGAVPQGQPNPHAVTIHGRLLIQPVQYAPLPNP